MTTPTVQFWFEFASTYSYLAAERIEVLAAAAGVTVVWKPFLLGPIFRAQGWNDSPFNIYAAKGRYMWRDMERCCAAYGIAFRRPMQFPRNGLLAARVACCLRDEPRVGEFVRAVYRANFAEDRDIGDASTITSLLDGLSLPAASILPASQSAEIKDRLRRQTDEAVHIGIFGAPSFVTGGELFWGNDRLEQALAWAVECGGSPPLAKSKLPHCKA